MRCKKRNRCECTADQSDRAKGAVRVMHAKFPTAGIHLPVAYADTIVPTQTMRRVKGPRSAAIG